MFTQAQKREEKFEKEEKQKREKTTRRREKKRKKREKFCFCAYCCILWTWLTKRSRLCNTISKINSYEPQCFSYFIFSPFSERVFSLLLFSLSVSLCYFFMPFLLFLPFFCFSLNPLLSFLLFLFLSFFCFCFLPFPKR